MKLKAVGSRIMIKPDLVEQKTQSGIVLAVDAKQERAGIQRGTVLSIGPLCWKNKLFGWDEPQCKVGDIVQFPRYSGKLICINDSPTTKDEDREFVIFINDEDVQAIIEEE